MRPQQHILKNEKLNDESDLLYGSLYSSNKKLKNSLENNPENESLSQMSTTESEEAICSPPAKRQSEYAQLSDFSQYFETKSQNEGKIF